MMRNIKTFESFCRLLNETTDYLELNSVDDEDENPLKFGMSDANAYPFVIKNNKVFISEEGNLDHYSFCDKIQSQLGINRKMISKYPMSEYLDYKGRLYMFDTFIVICVDEDLDLTEDDYKYSTLTAQVLLDKYPNKKIYLGIYDYDKGTELMPLIGSDKLTQDDWLSARRTELENKKMIKQSNDINDIRGTFNHFY